MRGRTLHLLPSFPALIHHHHPTTTTTPRGSALKSLPLSWTNSESPFALFRVVGWLAKLYTCVHFVCFVFCFVFLLSLTNLQSRKQKPWEVPNATTAMCLL